MAQSSHEQISSMSELDVIFDEFEPSYSENESDKCEVGSYVNKETTHNESFSEDNTEVFVEGQTNGSVCMMFDSSPSTSTPRFRSRNSSVRSVQTVDCSVAYAEGDGVRLQGIVSRSEYADDSEDSESERLITVEPVGRSNSLEEYPPDVNSDVVDEGLRLYLLFLHDEIMRNRLEAPQFLRETMNKRSSFPTNISSLRVLADRFALSPQRERVRLQAQEVELDTLNFRSFVDLLIGLFQEGGVTWERVVVLFFFCADLSIRALQEHLMRTFRRITDWTTRFICDNFCRWVQQIGGWSIILCNTSDSSSRIVLYSLCFVGFIALCVLVKSR